MSPNPEQWVALTNYVLFSHRAQRSHNLMRNLYSLYAHDLHCIVVVFFQFPGRVCLAYVFVDRILTVTRVQQRQCHKTLVCLIRTLIDRPI